MTGEDLVEKVAQVIYHHDGGMTDTDFLEVVGESRRLWKTDGPWDRNPGELCEHERDDYRVQARAVLEALGLLVVEG